MRRASIRLNDAMGMLRNGFRAQRSGKLAEALTSYQDALSQATASGSEKAPGFETCFSLTAVGLCTELYINTNIQSK